MGRVEVASRAEEDTYVGVAKRSERSPKVRKRGVLRDTFGAERLHRPVDDLERHGGNDKFGDTDLLEGTLGSELVDLQVAKKCIRWIQSVILGVSRTKTYLVRRSKDEQPRTLNLRPRLGDV